MNDIRIVVNTEHQGLTSYVMDLASAIGESHFYLWSPSKDEPVNALNYSSPSNTRVMRVGKAKTDKNKAERRIDKYGHDHPILREILSTVEGWDLAWPRPKKSSVKYNKRRFLQWKYETSLIALAENNGIWSREPMRVVAAWQICTHLLIPTNNFDTAIISQSPIIRFEVLNSIEDSSYEENDIALFETITSFIVNYIESIKHTLSCNDHYDHYRIPFSIEVYLNDTNLDRANNFRKWYQLHYKDISFGDWSLDQISHRCFVSLGSPPIPDQKEIRINQHPCIPPSIKKAEILLLMEFNLSSFLRLKDGFIYQKGLIDMANELKQQYGVPARQTLLNLGFDKKVYESLCEEDKEDYLEEIAINADMFFDDIESLLIASNLPDDKGSPPIIRLLTNMESKRHSFWIGFNKPPFDKFLENGLSYFMENGHPTKAIKASSKLRDNYKEIDNWANNCSITLIKPDSGFDSGIHLTRLWDMALGAIFLQDIYFSDVEKKTSWSEFKSISQLISSHLNGDTDDSQLCTSISIHLPKSLYAKK